MSVKKKVKKDLVIIGAGASGLMFASMYPSLDFALLDANFRVGKKLIISGGGKCNITNKNISIKNYYGEDEFILQVLKTFSPKELLGYFDTLEFQKRKQSQYFCKTSAKDVVDFLLNKIDKKKIFLGCEVLDVSYKDEKFYISSKSVDFEAKKVILASGGLSFKNLGASDIAYQVASKFGHSIATTKPALVGFTLQKDDFWMKKLSGVSLKVKIKVAHKEFYDDMLFTHRGISGPVILNTSLYWEKGSIMIDFLPQTKLELKHKQKQITSNLPLPKRFVKEFLLYLGLEDKKVQNLTKNEFEKLKKLKNYQLSPAGNYGFKKAEVTKGGIKIDKIDPKTLQSKLQKGLYFMGECLDVTGELGGYNLHFAFSCAKRINLYKS